MYAGDEVAAGVGVEWRVQCCPLGVWRGVTTTLSWLWHRTDSQSIRQEVVSRHFQTALKKTNWSPSSNQEPESRPDTPTQVGDAERMKVLFLFFCYFLPPLFGGWAWKWVLINWTKTDIKCHSNSNKMIKVILTYHNNDNTNTKRKHCCTCGNKE